MSPCDGGLEIRRKSPANPSQAPVIPAKPRPARPGLERDRLSMKRAPLARTAHARARFRGRASAVYARGSPCTRRRERPGLLSPAQHLASSRRSCMRPLAIREFSMTCLAISEKRPVPSPGQRLASSTPCRAEIACGAVWKRDRGPLAGTDQRRLTAADIGESPEVRMERVTPPCLWVQKELRRPGLLQAVGRGEASLLLKPWLPGSGGERAKKNPVQPVGSHGIGSAPERIRTSDLRLRRPDRPLPAGDPYPPERP